ncbi:MAG: ABC transporter ATP-binding protein [Anaerolineae bacterium]|nr:ABC transporter ATP-binding protein [Anaerolineae bacterium]
MEKITIENVRFSYTKDSPRIIDHLSLELNAGEIVLLVGPTGSGKTTLLQILAGVTPQVTGGHIAGQAMLDSTDILRTAGACRGRVGLVLQDPEAQLVNLTVRDEIIFGPENLNLPVDEINERLEWALHKCRLDAVREDYVYTLSGGQKQRIAIAAGLAMKPEVLLLDGPLTNLDPEGAREVMQTITELVETESTQLVIISSNKIDALLPLATRILVLDQGKIAFDEKPEDVLNMANRFFELGLFVPEVVSLWPAIRRKESGAVLPKTAEEAAKVLRRHNPTHDVIRKNAITNSNQQEPLIEIEDVSFDYGRDLVLSGIDLNVKKGEFAAVVGQNGSGKSTLMSLITGLRTPKSGSIKIAGKNIKDFSPQGIVGYVFQYPEHQFVAETVGKELRFGLLDKMEPDEMERRVNEITSLFGMEGREEESPYSLSTGEKRMLSVASMLVLRPQLLILDEPTTGLDRHLTTNLMDILRRFVEESGLTVLQVSHDMEQIAEYCTKVAVIDQGKIVFTGTPRQLFLNQDVLRRAKLDAPVICQIAEKLFPDDDTIPVTVYQFLEEVHYAGH